MSEPKTIPATFTSTKNALAQKVDSDFLLFVCMIACVFVCLCIIYSMQVHIRRNSSMSVHVTCIRICVYIYLCTCIYLYEKMYTCIYMDIYAHIYIYIYMYIHSEQERDLSLRHWCGRSSRLGSSSISLERLELPLRPPSSSILPESRKHDDIYYVL